MGLPASCACGAARWRSPAASAAPPACAAAPVRQAPRCGRTHGRSRLQGTVCDVCVRMYVCARTGAHTCVYARHHHAEEPSLDRFILEGLSAECRVESLVCVVCGWVVVGGGYAITNQRESQLATLPHTVHSVVCRLMWACVHALGATCCAASHSSITLSSYSPPGHTAP